MVNPVFVTTKKPAFMVGAANFGYYNLCSRRIIDFVLGMFITLPVIIMPENFLCRHVGIHYWKLPMGAVLFAQSYKKIAG